MCEVDHLMSHPKAGPAEQATLNAANQTQQQRMAEVGAVDKATDPYMGDPSQTPYFRTETQLGRESTARAYDTAKAGMAAQAHMAGYGYEQPATQAADMGVNLQEASQLADVPRYALMDSASKGLQAAGIRSGEVSALNPSSDFNTATGAEVKRETYSPWASIAGTALGIGSRFIPGFGAGNNGGPVSVDTSGASVLSPQDMSTIAPQPIPGVWPGWLPNQGNPDAV